MKESTKRSDYFAWSNTGTETEDEGGDDWDPAGETTEDDGATEDEEELPQDQHDIK